MTNYEKAVELGNNSGKLFRRLLDAKNVLSTEHRALFHGEKQKFSLEKKCLTGKGGVTLQWKVRRHPDKPISYNNQQTSMGIVLLM